MDFRVYYVDGATVGLLLPFSPEAKDWIRENVDVTEAQWHGDCLVVEHRYLPDIVQGIQDDGLSVERHGGQERLGRA